ncbi:MAG: tetratricopeptide repeat protein [Planctomycetota bacterium]|jgi:TolA-binding protein
MKRFMILTLIVPAPFALAAMAQGPPVDAAGQEAVRLEAELGKYKDTSPEAAEVLVKLVDLYHAGGRVFGLIRAAETFVAAHPGDGRHPAVMLKLIDGLEATSRNKEMVAACRQFLDRYRDARECADVEVRLADTLRRMNSRLPAAEACRLVWNRQPNTPLGRRYGAMAVDSLYRGGGTQNAIAAAELAEEMLDKSPPGDFAKWIGYRAFHEWKRIGQPARSNVVGNKLLKKGIAGDKDLLWELHSLMAENYHRQQQYANAVDATRKARQLRDTNPLHRQLIERMHAAEAAPRQMDPLVAEYRKKYPTHEDRHRMEGFLACAYLRSGDKPRGLELLAQVLNHDAEPARFADTFVRESGTEPAELAAAERALQTAIENNRRDACYLRYVLGFRLYRDLMKDDAKARAVFRELVAQSPTDRYSREAIEWLLFNPENEGRAEIRDRVQHVAAMLKQADGDPSVGLWLRYFHQDARRWPPEVSSLLEPGTFDKLNSQMARALAWKRAEYLRSYGTRQERAESGPFLAKACQRFRDDYPLAERYLQLMTDYGSAEQCKAAAAHLLTFEPRPHGYDVWRRLLVAADKNEDVRQAREAYAWIMKAQERHGRDPGQASAIGDGLLRRGMEKEAVEYWTVYVSHNRRHAESKSCADRLYARLEGDERIRFAAELARFDTDYHGAYAQWQTDEYLKAGDLDNFEKVLRAARARQDQRPLRGWGFYDDTAKGWIDKYRNDAAAPETDRLRVFRVVHEVAPPEASAQARLALLEIDKLEVDSLMQRLLAHQETTRMVRNDGNGWYRVLPYAQSALGRNDYQAAATLLTGMLANVPNVDRGRKAAARDLVAQCYARIGAVGLTIDERSPIAPLLRAALSLRLGDERLAFDAYVANRPLFSRHYRETPVDLVLFVCEKLIAAGGDRNHEHVEEVLRGWLVKHGDSPHFDDATKAEVLLFLARNYYKAQRYDVARSEFTTIMNRYADTPQAVEAEFGVGETFMAQRVYDQAEAVFEKLAASREMEIAVRAEFLRGVLALRRGDHDDARDIFRAVLDRVPEVALANRALFSLSEVYGAEQRYLDQLRLLRTVGRLGQHSKRYHAPGVPLSIVVHDSDLGISRGHHRIPVTVTTQPGGDRETIYLVGAGAGRGLFRTDMETCLGSPVPGDKVLQLTGRDVVRCDYPDEFKAEFRAVPLSDVEIHVASDAELQAASSKIVDEEEESPTARLERETMEEEETDQRVSQGRPPNQIKPGNQIYLRVKDADRDLSEEADRVIVKLVAEGGDQVQAALFETGAHTGVFEGTVATGELPAGALATDAAIDHGPLKAIDRDPNTFWQSQPDGATPKSLTVDMKNLRKTGAVVVSTPGADGNAPVRAELQGSHDGEFWFHLAGEPPLGTAEPVAGECGRMTRRVYNGRYRRIESWDDVVRLTNNAQPIAEDPADRLQWARPDEEEEPARRGSYVVVWRGILVEPRASAARIAVAGDTTALCIDGRILLPVGTGAGSVDVWLDAGAHEVTIVAVAGPGRREVEATWARADLATADVKLRPFRASDFDLNQVDAETKPARQSSVTRNDDAWQFQFDPIELRYVRFIVHEYLGQSVAVNNVEIRGEEAGQVYIPTEADVLALSTNEVLEIAGGDVVRATYTDEFTQLGSGYSQLLTSELTATYFNAQIAPIAYDFVRRLSGAVETERKQLLRVDPGERVIVEITDYDADVTDQRDEVRLQVSVNGGQPMEMVATETEEYSGVFTKEVDTEAEPAEGKLTVKPGDRILCQYVDEQNTFPGHSVSRDAIVLVNEPTEGLVRVLQTRVITPAPETGAAPRIEYAAPEADDQIGAVALAAPLSVEVVDPDAAKDSRSSVVVSLSTSDGAKADVRCVVSGDCRPDSYQQTADERTAEALAEGRFVGQVILQLGGTASPQIVPRTINMPRSLVGGPPVDDASGEPLDERLVTRVLNLTGKDVVTATYTDANRPDDQAADLEARARLVTNGTLDCTDSQYREPVTQLHVGEKMFLKVVDADRDASDERDVVSVEIATEKGEKESIQLEETLTHSGVFTGSFRLSAAEQPTPDNFQVDDPAIESYFGDMVRVRYLDEAAATETGDLETVRELPVVIGTDGLLTAFTKAFADEELAVETKFHIAESYFELFKSHKDLGRDEEQKADLKAGRQLLREVMEDYADPKYAPRVAYLLGQFAQELEQWDEAVESYELILRRYPDHTLAADAHYKLGQCHEKSGDFDEALEAYVTLAATHPNSPLIASAMIRVSDYFYKNKVFQVAAQVGEKFLEKFVGHQHAARMAFRVGQCYYKLEDYLKAAETFDRFVKTFPDEELAADALFWAGESYREGRRHPEAFQRYNRCRWDFPASDAAKYARGRLAMPEMLRLFEEAADVLE